MLKLFAFSVLCIVTCLAKGAPVVAPPVRLVVTLPAALKLNLDTACPLFTYDTAHHELHLAPSGGDDYPQLQAAVDFCKNGKCAIKLSTDNFYISRPVMFVDIANGDYRGISFEIGGYVNAMNPAGAVTTIIPTFSDAPAFIVQMGKGSLIYNIDFKGPFGYMGSYNNWQVDTLSFLKWFNGRTYNRIWPVAGIAFDPFSDPAVMGADTALIPAKYRRYYLSNMSRSGSTACRISGCFFQGFDLAIGWGTNWQYNDELMMLEHSQIDNCISGVSTDQAQAKQDVVRDCLFWGNVNTIVDGVHWGPVHKDGACLPEFYGNNVAGPNHMLIAGYTQNQQVRVHDNTTESIYKLCDFGAGGYFTSAGVNFTNNTFDLPQDGDGIPMPDFYARGEGIIFVQDSWRIYDGEYHTRIPFADYMSTFRDCIFSSPPVIGKVGNVVAGEFGPVAACIPARLTNCKSYTTDCFFPETPNWFTHGTIGSQQINIDRSNFMGYIVDTSHTLRLYDNLFTQRMNEDDNGVGKNNRNDNYPVGTVYKIKGDTYYLYHMGQGLRQGDRAVIYYDRIK